MIRLGDPAAFGASLIGLRQMFGVTQKQLATDAGLWQSQVSHWESGQRIPDLPSIVKLANALGYDLALVPRGEDGPLAALSAPVSAQQPSAQGVDGNGPETGTAGSETVHLVHDGYGTTRCCHRSPFELPTTERITYDPDAATCVRADERSREDA